MTSPTVNIVCRNFEANRILPRFSRHLQIFNGWNVSAKVDTKYNVNYYMAYFEQQKNRDYQGKLISYFTHVEPGKKAELYNQVASLADLRIAMNYGQLTHLRTYGPSIQLPLPIDMSKFTLRSGKSISIKPIVGVSGYVYNSGRKGVPLLTKAMAEFSTRALFKASGKGWPCPTKFYSWGDMPKFYQHLDIFLCTSLIEGGPMTTLEALACGIPVVIPADLGIHPQLSYIPGIYRYILGNYDSMASALAQALQEVSKIDRTTLREAVSPHCVKAFVEGHQEAIDFYFRKKIASKPQAVVLDKPKTVLEQSGIYIVAFGEPARKCANRCIRACKRFMPTVPVALCAVSPLNVGEDIFIESTDMDIGGRQAKLAAYNLAPKEWKYVLYLDADTEPVESLEFIFNTLAKGWDIIICKDMAKYSVARFMLRADNKPEATVTWNLMGTDETMQYNGGLFGFSRSEVTEEFFRLWNYEWQVYAGRDQGALLRALYTQPVKLFLLGNQWNASDRYPAPVVGKVALWHHNIEARRWAGKVGDRLDSKKAWGMVDAWQKQHGHASPKNKI